MVQNVSAQELVGGHADLKTRELLTGLLMEVIGSSIQVNRANDTIETALFVDMSLIHVRGEDYSQQFRINTDSAHKLINLAVLL